MQFISHLTEDGPSTCSSSPGCWIGWLGVGGGASASSIAILILHSKVWGMNGCRQGGGRCRPAITINWKVLHLWEDRGRAHSNIQFLTFFVLPTTTLHPFMAKCFTTIKYFFLLSVDWLSELLDSKPVNKSVAMSYLHVEVKFEDWILNNHWRGKAFFLF